MLGEGAISTAENFDALDRYFVQRPAPSDASFYEKLETQLADAPHAARKLMAEMLWALFLFPSTIGTDNKQAGAVRVWGLVGEPLDPAPSPKDAERVDGIGKAG